jgi:phage baseplate assembly protein W
MPTLIKVSVQDSVGVTDQLRQLHSIGGGLYATDAWPSADASAVSDVLSITYKQTGVTPLKAPRLIHDAALTLDVASSITNDHVKPSDHVGIKDDGVVYVTTRAGSPVQIGVLLFDGIGSSDGTGVGRGVGDTISIADRAGVSGYGLTDTIGVTDWVKGLPDKVILRQADAVLERLNRAVSTTAPALNTSADIRYRGIALPTTTRRFPHIKEELDLIRDSVITILMTKKGQRFFVPDFGSDLWRIIFEPNDVVTRSLAKQYITSALRIWEPRVIVRRLDIVSDEHTITIYLDLLVRRIKDMLSMQLDVSRDNFTLLNQEAA